MELTILVCLLVLVEYLILSSLVGSARVQYDVPAPQTTGHPTFERKYRVQQNTVEQLVVFLPSALAFSYFVHDAVAAGLGVIFLLGRILYYRGYVRDPKRRGLGMLLTFWPNVVLLLGALIGVGRRILVL